MLRFNVPVLKHLLVLLFGVTLVATLSVTEARAAATKISLDVSRVGSVSTAEWEFSLSWDEDHLPRGPRTIPVTWADGYRQDVQAAVYQGGHTLYRTSNHLGACVSGATAAVYSGWAGQFSVSRGPCTTKTRRLRYVALGDSYSSGEGNPPFDVDTDDANNMCHRSGQAWPRKLGNQVGSVDLVGHIACSGAVAANVTSYGKWYIPDNMSQVAQLDQISADGFAPDLVTMTIGGNDFAFSDLLTNCVVSNCVKNGSLANIRTYIQSPAFPTTVHRAYETVAAHMALDSRLVAVGYPNIINPRTTNAKLHCPWLSADENRELVALTKTIDGILTDPAVSWGSTVSVVDALQGHELCTAKPWVHTIDATSGNLRGHPTGPGQAAISKRVMGYLHMS